MGYLDLNEAGLTGGTARLALDQAAYVPTAGTGFSALEWLVIALAERDRLSSLASPGRIAAALHRLFGANNAKSRLANPRLEALRRFAVLAWHHGGVVARSDRGAFLAAGFSADQADTLLENIIRRRGGRRVGASA